VFQSTLRKYRDTLLGSEELQEYYDPDSGEHIIDTDPQIFYTILHFYQTKGHLYCPPSITEERFLDEVRMLFCGWWGGGALQTFQHEVHSS
jgi:potassium voltage-gated channel Shal-related subfamily D protein